jgi:quercetin dioxygenase-like cupin family protein
MTKIGSRIGMLSLAVLVFTAASAMGQTAEAGKMTAMHKGTEVIWPAGNLKWVDAPNAPPGVKQVVLWGDPTKGHFAALQKFPAGFSAPLHSHTANLHMIIISGTVVHTPEGKADVRLPANSYLMDPSGYKHGTKCEAAADCVFFLEGDGKFDIVMADKK